MDDGGGEGDEHGVGGAVEGGSGGEGAGRGFGDEFGVELCELSGACFDETRLRVG